MKRLRVAARDRRALLIGVLGVFAALALSRGAPMYAGWLEESIAERREAQAEVAHGRALISHADAARESTIVRGRRLIGVAPAILIGETVNAAGATLAGILSGAAAQSGVKLGTVQLRSDSLSHGAFTRVGARVDATGDIRGVMQMLALLETGPTLLRVRSFGIAQSDVSAGDDRTEALHVEIETEGLMLNPRKAP